MSFEIMKADVAGASYFSLPNSVLFFLSNKSTVRGIDKIKTLFINSVIFPAGDVAAFKQQDDMIVTNRFTS
jgi:hypothetical protein